MIRKLFALASVSALAGLVSAMGAAGCAETTVQPGPSDDAGTDAKTKADARAPVGDDEEPVVEQCYKDDAIDVSTYPYKPARVQAGSCTPAVFDVIKDVLEAGGGSASLSEVRDAIATKESATCVECVFAEDDDTWAPFVTSGETTVHNIGGCFEMLSGKASCGKAVQQWNKCLGKACEKCEGAEGKECTQAVQTTACKDSTDNILKECGQVVFRAEVRHRRRRLDPGALRRFRLHQGRRYGLTARLT
jgi:hypothetical protein